MHASSTLSGGSAGIRLDYFELLRHRLSQPLILQGAGGVPEVTSPCTPAPAPS